MKPLVSKFKVSLGSMAGKALALNKSPVHPSFTRSTGCLSSCFLYGKEPYCLLSREAGLASGSFKAISSWEANDYISKPETNLHREKARVSFRITVLANHRSQLLMYITALKVVSAAGEYGCGSKLHSARGGIGT